LHFKTQNIKVFLWKSSIFFISFLIITQAIYSQKSIYFTALDRTPRVVSSELYNELKKTINPDQKLNLLYKIAEIYVNVGETDSTLFYARKIDDVISTNQEKIKEINSHKIKAQRLFTRRMLSI